MGNAPMTADERECLDRLSQWKNRIDALMAMYDRDRAFIPAVDIASARALYVSLKADLRAEHQRLSNSRRRPRNPAEDRWYTSTIHAALNALSAPTNSRPEKWFSGLYDASTDFSHMLGQMRDHFGVKG